MALPPLPLPAPPFRLAMGLQALKPDDWIDLDAAYPEHLAVREELIGTDAEAVVAFLDEASDAVEELQATLVAHLLRVFPDSFASGPAGTIVTPDDRRVRLGGDGNSRLRAIGRLVQEDFCLLQANDPAGPYRLTAAVLCFPTRWKLHEKIGKPLLEIHAPVPGYDATLGRPVDRFFTLLRADKPVWRVNWSLLDHPALFQPEGHFRGERNPAVTAENAGDALFLRFERQTLLRLPHTGAIVFGIRVHQRPLRSLATDPAWAGEFAAVIRSVPSEMGRYKSLPPVRDAALAWLDRAASGAPIAG